MVLSQFGSAEASVFENRERASDGINAIGVNVRKEKFVRGTGLSDNDPERINRLGGADVDRTAFAHGRHITGVLKRTGAHADM